MTYSYTDLLATARLGPLTLRRVIELGNSKLISAAAGLSSPDRSAEMVSGGEYDPSDRTSTPRPSRVESDCLLRRGHTQNRCHLQ
jgi:hypothetical protein